MLQTNPAKTTEEVVVSIRKGEMDKETGFRRIFDEIDPHIYYLIQRTTKIVDDDEIADIAATVWTEILQSINTFDPEIASFRTWAGKIAQFRAIDYIRAAEARPKFESLDGPTSDSVRSESVEQLDERTPLEEVVDKETEISVLSALMELPEFDRTLYLLYLNFDLTHADLAEIATRARGEPVTERAVQGRIYRTREKLLAALRNQGNPD